MCRDLYTCGDVLGKGKEEELGEEGEAGGGKER